MDGHSRKRLKKYPNVDFKLGDISSLAIDDNAYDVIVVHFVLPHVAERERHDKVGCSLALKVGARLFIREPTRETHGTSVDEIRQLMSKAGLFKRESRITRSLLMGPVYDEVFERPPP